MTRAEIQAKIQQLMVEREKMFASMNQMTGMIAAFEEVLNGMPTGDAQTSPTDAALDGVLLGGDDAADR